MVRELMHDPIFLARKSEPAGKEDLEIARDLLDTLVFHKEGCVGMAANMIGVTKRIIAFDNEGSYTVMLNPVILKASGEYETEEGCLSPAGRPPEDEAVSEDQGAVPEPAAAGEDQDLHRLDGSDHPA